MWSLKRQNECCCMSLVEGIKGLEPSVFCSEGRRVSQLHHIPKYLPGSLEDDGKENKKEKGELPFIYKQLVKTTPPREGLLIGVVRGEGFEPSSFRFRAWHPTIRRPPNIGKALFFLLAEEIILLLEPLSYVIIIT